MIYASKKFQDSFQSPAAYKAFAGEFSRWKAASDSCSFAMFGRDRITQIDIGHDFDHLFHVHLEPATTNGIPEDQDSFDAWKRAFEGKDKNRRCDRTSRRFLFYATFDSHYLLMAFDEHPPFPGPNKIEALCKNIDSLVAKIRQLQKNTANP